MIVFFFFFIIRVMNVFQYQSLLKTISTKKKREWHTSGMNIGNKEIAEQYPEQIKKNAKQKKEETTTFA